MRTLLVTAPSCTDLGQLCLGAAQQQLHPLRSTVETEHSRLQQVLTEPAFLFSCYLNKCPLNHIFQNKMFPRRGCIFIPGLEKENGERLHDLLTPVHP